MHYDEQVPTFILANDAAYMDLATEYVGLCKSQGKPLPESISSSFVLSFYGQMMLVSRAGARHEAQA